MARTYGMVVGHVAPQLRWEISHWVQEGDSITIDVDARLLQLNVPSEVVKVLEIHRAHRSVYSTNRSL